MKAVLATLGAAVFFYALGMVSLPPGGNIDKAVPKAKQMDYAQIPTPSQPIEIPPPTQIDPEAITKPTPPGLNNPPEAPTPPSFEPTQKPYSSGSGVTENPRPPVFVPRMPGTSVVPGRRAGKAISSDFLGFSWETWMLPQMIGFKPGQTSPAGRLIRNLSGGAGFSLRLGGDSQDRSWWIPSTRGIPKSLLQPQPVSHLAIAKRIPAAKGTRYLITPAWVSRLARFSHQNQIRNLVGLNFGSNAPRRSRDYAAHVVRKLGWRYIQGFEIGNEPNLYGLWRREWEQRKDGSLVRTNRPDPLEWNEYIRKWKAHRSILRRVAPSRKIIGPAIPCPFSSWCPLVGDFYQKNKRGFGMSTLHLYAMPLNTPRTRDQLLSDPYSKNLGGQMIQSAKLARRHGVPLRLDEWNTSAHGGMPGTSDSFASALWAPTAMMSMANVGVDGLNVHFGYGTSYKPFWIRWKAGRAQAQVHPLYYGLQLWAWAARGKARIVSSRQTQSSPGMDTWILRDQKGVQKALLVNRSSRPHRVNLFLDSQKKAYLIRMRAASPGSLGGVTIRGQRFGSDGRLHGKKVVYTVRPHRKAHSLGMPAYSAALLSLGR